MRLSRILRRVSALGRRQRALILGRYRAKCLFDKVCALAEAAKADGATFMTGGSPLDRPGYFFPVTIVRDIPEDSRLVQEEPFGPILPIIRTQ